MRQSDWVVKASPIRAKKKCEGACALCKQPHQTSKKGKQHPPLQGEGESKHVYPGLEGKRKGRREKRRKGSSGDGVTWIRTKDTNSKYTPIYSGLISFCFFISFFTPPPFSSNVLLCIKPLPFDPPERHFPFSLFTLFSLLSTTRLPSIPKPILLYPTALLHSNGYRNTTTLQKGLG